MRVDDGRPSNDVDIAAMPANVLAVQRVFNEYLLRSIDGMVAAQDNDLIAALIYAALWLANVRHITYSAANVEFGGMDDLPPDALRRPVSVQALANALRIPYETVRRYAQAMIRNGVCIRIGKRGLIVPTAVHNQPQRRKAIQDGMSNLLRLLSDLKQAGFDFAPYRHALANTMPLPSAGGMPANGRALLRVSMELVMRGLEMIGRQHGNDFLSGMIYTAIWTANVRHITYSSDNLKYGSTGQLLPDEMRQPVTVNTIAGSLRLPYETTRRYVSDMVHAGRAVRIGGKGVIIPGAQFRGLDYHRAALESYRHVQSAVSDLHRAGFDFRTY